MNKGIIFLSPAPTPPPFYIGSKIYRVRWNVNQTDPRNVIRSCEEEEEVEEGEEEEEWRQIAPLSAGRRFICKKIMLGGGHNGAIGCQESAIGPPPPPSMDEWRQTFIEITARKKSRSRSFVNNSKCYVLPPLIEIIPSFLWSLIFTKKKKTRRIRRENWALKVLLIIVSGGKACSLNYEDESKVWKKGLEFGFRSINRGLEMDLENPEEIGRDKLAFSSKWNSRLELNVYIYI